MDVVLRNVMNDLMYETLMSDIHMYILIATQHYVLT